MILSRKVVEGNIIGFSGIILIIIIDKFPSILKYINWSKVQWKNYILFWLSVFVLWLIYIFLVIRILFAYLYLQNYFEFLTMLIFPYIYIILFVTFVQYKIFISSGNQHQIDIRYNGYLRGKYYSVLLKLFLIYSYSFLIIALSFVAVELFLQLDIKELHLNAFAGGFVGALLSFLVWLIRDDTIKWNQMTSYRYLHLVFISNTMAHLFSFIYVFL